MSGPAGKAPRSQAAGNVGRSRWLLFHAAAVFSFLYLPVAVLILYSFNGQGVGGFILLRTRIDVAGA